MFDKVVPESSAILNLHNELTFPLNAAHRTMCRYDSERNQNYLLVESAIKEIGLPKAVSPHDTTCKYDVRDFVSWPLLTEQLLTKLSVSDQADNKSVNENDYPIVYF